MSTYIFGDIHGGRRALDQILEMVKLSTNDRLIFLGDYVDGWSQSLDVIDLLIDLSKTYHCTFIRGNHDQLFLDWLLSSGKNIDEQMWFKHGGQATVESYKGVSNEKKQAHINFLQSLKDYYIDDQNRLFVHAGFTNLHGVKYEYFPKMFYWDRTLWETALSLDESLDQSSAFYPMRFKIYKEIFIGHTPTTKINSLIPVNKACVWNIDTGAAFKGKLTMMDIDTKQFWQSDCLPDLYPDEVGRN